MLQVTTAKLFQWRQASSIKQFLCTFNQTVIVQLSHVVTFTHSTIQDGWTALKQASFNGHLKMVELLLEAGAYPDLQNKVRAGQVHANLAN